MSDLDEEFTTSVTAINQGKSNFSDDEQNIIDSWVTKLSEPADTDEEKTIRNEYARTLARLVNDEKQLLPPFTESPPDGELIPLSELGEEKKYPFQIKKMPCSWPKRGQGTGAIPKTKKYDRSQEFDSQITNEYEDPEEMAIAVARSKGQEFAEFVASVSRYTSDSGRALRQAMKSETGSFRDYVEHVLSQRIKDLTEVLDEEQNRQLQKIKKDIDGWQMELSHVKRRIKDIVPDFDINLYRKDRGYLRKLFKFDTPNVQEDDLFTNWKEESTHRLKWISDTTCKVMRCRENISAEIKDLEKKMAEMEAKEATERCEKLRLINRQIAQYNALKLQRDKLQRENMAMLSQAQGTNN